MMGHTKGLAASPLACYIIKLGGCGLRRFDDPFAKTCAAKIEFAPGLYVEVDGPVEAFSIFANASGIEAKFLAPGEWI